MSRRYSAAADTFQNCGRETSTSVRLESVLRRTHRFKALPLDLIKIAMIRIDKQLTEQGFNAKMLLQVHDELVFEAPRTSFRVLLISFARKWKTLQSSPFPW
jgi:hypothetical protein